MKMIKYRDDSGEPPVIISFRDIMGVIGEFFDNSDFGQKATIEIVELTQEEYDAIPEYWGKHMTLGLTDRPYNDVREFDESIVKIVD